MKLILDTELCRIVQDKAEIKVFVKITEGGWVEHHPFTPDARGLVGALTVATDICAGKFWLQKLVKDSDRVLNVAQIVAAKEKDPNERCECGHKRIEHVYEEGACRPGYKCADQCIRFRPKEGDA